MNRRTFLCGLTLGTLAAPLAVEAQEAGKTWRIGFLSPYSADFDQTWRAAFKQGLRDIGYVEGKNLVIDERHVKGRYERFPEVVADLVRLKVDVFVVHGSSDAVRAAEQASSAIPIVFIANPDPVGLGLVSSLARPGGRVTGLSDFHSALVAKRLELLKEAAPSISRVAVLYNSTAMSRNALRDTQTAAPKLNLTVLPMEIRLAPEPGDIDGVFTRIRGERAEALNVLFGAANVHVSRVADLAIKNRIPTIGNGRINTDNGYLMSYGANFPDLYRRAASYVDKILKGTKPGDLPVEQPTKFEFVVNLKTAKKLGLTIPQTLLLRADQVIE
jgi:putative tryptophan/tyrosine transport system substrate-binding protein